MSKISEVEIKAMSKEQNYLKGYSDGKSDTLDKIRAEIRKKIAFNSFNEGYVLYDDIVEVLDKYKAESEDKE